MEPRIDNCELKINHNRQDFQQVCACDYQRYSLQIQWMFGLWANIFSNTHEHKTIQNEHIHSYFIHHFMLTKTKDKFF